MTSRELKTTRLSFGTIFLVVFILVSGGPYGVEEMVAGSGPGIALLLLLVIPLVWGGPIGLICAELASAIPDEGGPYVWIDRAFGKFWAFQYGWWSTISGMFDTALYVVLAVRYANSSLGQPPLVQWLLSVGVIAVFAALNVRSLRSMALSSVGFALVLLLPCAVLAVLGIAHWSRNPFEPFTLPGQSIAGSLGLGLTVAIWFYAGYESMSTMAGEVAEPQKVIPRALLLSLPAVVLVYFLPTAAALASVGRWEEWGTDGPITLVQVAEQLGGRVLALATLVGALVSCLALYNAYLASGARTTLVMAEARLLPRPFARVHPRYGTPSGSILITAAAHAALVALPLETILVFDVFLFVIYYLLIMGASVALRVTEPALPRPFRIPLSTAGLTIFVAIPTLVGLLLLVANGKEYLVYGSLVAATGPVAYLLLDR